MTNKAGQTPVGVYVHLPFCRSRCAYCGFTSSCVGEFDMHAYVRTLESEIAARVRGDVDTVYIGGGTPSVLPRGEIGGILRAVRRAGRLCADAEITAEANPDSCDEAFLREVADGGGNRISLGVQSCDDAVLRAAGRRHTAAQADEAIALAYRVGFTNVSCDLMIGLPGDSRETVLSSVRRVCDAGCKHLSLYALGVEEGTPLYARGYTYDEDEAADTYAAAVDVLRAYGLARYEVSNFAAAGYESRHNRKYWRRAPYIGVGAAAHSFDGARRYANTTDIARYIAGERDTQGRALTRREVTEEVLMLGLRTRDGVHYADIRAADETWERKKAAAVDDLTRRGFLCRDEKGFRLSETAYYVMNEIVVRLFP